MRARTLFSNPAKSLLSSMQRRRSDGTSSAARPSMKSSSQFMTSPHWLRYWLAVLSISPNKINFSAHA